MRNSLVSLCLLGFGIAPAWAGKVELRPDGDEPAGEVISALRRELADETVPETAFQARRQALRAESQVRDLLNSKGYFAPELTPVVETADGLQPVVMVDPGPRFTLADVRIDYLDAPPHADDIEKIASGLSVQPGDVAIPAEVIAQEVRLVSALHEAGYPFAEAESRKVIGDKDAATLDVAYQIRSGPRVLLGEVIYPDDVRTSQRYLQKLESFQPGALYSPDTLAKFSSRLSDTRLFTISSLNLTAEPISVAENGDEVRGVEVTLKERKRNTIEAGLSLSTDKGIGLSSTLTRRNLTRRADTLVTKLDVTAVEQTLDLQWRLPNVRRLGRSQVFGAALSNEDTDAYVRKTFALNGGYEVRRGGLTYGYGAKASLVNETDDFGKRDLQLVGLYANASIDRADKVLNATRGWKAEARVEPNVSFGGDETQFIRGVAQVRGYFPVAAEERLIIAGRVRAGTVWGADLDALPSSSRFFAGGGGSVRGFGYQEIGPRAADNTPTGGRSLLETSIEMRWKVQPKISVVGFVDAGGVTKLETPGFSDLRVGAGVGVRYETPAGPMRIDIATPLDTTVNDEPVQIYISLGQAF